MGGECWGTKRLGEVANINPDAIGRDWPYPHLRYIDISSVGVGQIESPPQMIKVSDAPSRAKRLVRKGDTVLSTVRPNRRSMFFASEPSDDWVVSTGFVVLRPNIKLVEPRFLYTCVFNQDFTEYLITREKGAAYPAVSPEDIANAEIPIPPLKEQQAIACILGAFDDKIELNRQMNRTLEEMARAIFKSWFVDFDPVRAKAAVRRAHPSWTNEQVSRAACPNLKPEIAELFPDAFEDSELGQIPKGWKASIVHQHFRLTMGQSPPGSTYNEIGEGVPFYQGRTDFGFRFPTRRVFCTAPTRFAETGDTLVSIRAPVGDVNMANERCAVGRGVAAIRHRSGSRSFTYYSMKYLGKHFDQFEAEGTVFGCINKSDFERLPFVSPEPDILTVFEQIVSPLDDRLETNECQSLILASIRDALLPKLISGELRVKDAEKFVERVAI